jgi:hypothetical protein
MTALYIIGGAICAAMWLGLIYLMAVEPIRLYLHNRKLRSVEPRVVARSARPARVGWGGGSYRTQRPTHA